MKLTTIMLLAAVLQVSAKGNAQTITYSGKTVSLQKVFAAIEEQTGYTFFYRKEDLKGAQPVTIQLKDVPLLTALKEILTGQPLEFEMQGKTVFITKKPAAGKQETELNVQNSVPPVTGIIRDAKGKPLEGINIIVKGTRKGATSSVDGKFSIDANVGDKLIISSVGYGSKEITVSAGLIVVELEINSSPLDEVQIIAYGQTSQRFSTGNVATVKGEDIAKAPVSNPLLALQGRVPGLTIQQANGLPGGSVTIRIQGQNSLGRGNDPLIVVDGVPYPTSNLPTVNQVLNLSKAREGEDVYGPKGAGSPLNFINPNDIESIDILKDADATSIYGSRAANGAILITTKKGKAGAMKVDLKLQHGVGEITRKMKLLNTEQYLEVRREAYKNSGLPVPDASTPPDGSNFDLTYWDQHRYTDWQEVLLGRTAQYTNANASISGGTANTQYLVSGTYRRQTTVYLWDFANQSGSIHLNLNNTSTNQRLKTNISVQYLIDDNRLPNNDLTSYVMRLAPNAPALFNADGGLNWEPLPDGRSSFGNPLARSQENLKIKTTNLISNASISYRILPGLELSGRFSYANLYADELATTPILSYAPEDRPTGLRFTAKNYSTISTWQAEPQLSYHSTIGEGKLEALLGVTFLQTKSDQVSYAGYGTTSDLFLEDINAQPHIITLGALANLYRHNAIFGRLNYTWRDKYILNLTARRDGSSRFGSENLFYNFGSIGGAWLFSNEDLIRDHLSFLSFGKLQFSYGTMGNDNIGNYEFMTLYNMRNVFVPYQGVNAIEPTKLPNASLQWEETRKLSGTLSLGFLHDRVLLYATWYRNRSSNQLLSFRLPSTTGYNSITYNFPAVVQNSGWELSLNTTNIKSKTFTWNSSINFTIPRNKVLEFPGLATSSYANSLILGQPIDATKYFHYLGVDPQTGLYIFEDKNGHPTSTPSWSEDRTVLQTIFPKYYGGFLNSFSYKGLQLEILFQFTKQISPNYTKGALPGIAANQPAYILDRWQKPGDIAAVQKYAINYTGDLDQAYGAYGFSDAGFGDASFARLENLSLSWQLPDTWSKKARLQRARLFLQGQNLLTLTSFGGLDPEQRVDPSDYSMPPLRVITMGIQLIF